MVYSILKFKNMAQIKKSATEIKIELNKAEDWVMASETDVRSMTYEEGVANALKWVLGEMEGDDPIENTYKLEE